MKKSFAILFIIIAITLCFPMYASADMGPKPKIKIIISNPPKGEYYLDLLVDYSSENAYHNHVEPQNNPERIKILESYREGNWRPALLTGTSSPLWGKLTGTPDGDKMVHDFGYMGVPDRYKIAILTDDNRITVSQEITRSTFDSTIYYDFKTNSITQKPVAVSFLLQFLFTCVCTLLIEGVILLLFGFNIKQNWKPFLIINIITQIFLNLILSTVMLSTGLLLAFILYIPLELIILIVEILCFAKFLKQHSKARRVVFAVTANIVSSLIGFIIIPTTFNF